jgi:dienelactone hydrolase
MGWWPSGRVKDLPAPSGEHAIGTTAFDVMGEGAQRVPVRAWYPAQPGSGAREPSLDDALRSALAAQLHLPRFLLPRNPSASTIDAPAAPGRFPVLVFNHGVGSFQKQSASLLEELASHGFVVLSVGHPGQSLVVQFSDGATLALDRASPAWRAVAVGPAELERQAGEVQPLLERARAARTPEALREVMQAVAGQPSYAALVPVLEAWTRDTRQVLDALGPLDDGALTPVLRGHLDAPRLGVLGHSLGGILAGQLAMREPRVRAGMSFDGAQLPPPGDGPYRLLAPFAFLYADTTRLGRTTVSTEGVNDALAAAGPRGSCSAVLTGAGHLNFTDLNNLSMAARALGSIDRGVMATVLRAATVGFFAHHLRGTPLTGFTPSPTLRVLHAPG